MADVYDFWADRIPAAEAAMIDRFWEAFVQIAPSIDHTFSGTGDPVDVAEVMQTALGDLAEMIPSWEFGPAEDGHHLALSPDFSHELRPLVRAMVNRAPEIPRFTIHDARQPHPDLAGIPDVVASRMFQPFTLTGAEAMAGEHRRIDLVGSGPGADSDAQAGLLFSVLVGEAVERDWLGEIAVQRSGPGMLSRMFGKKPAAADPMDWLPGFKDQVDAVLAELMDARPATPMAEPLPGADGLLYQITPTGSEGPRADSITYQTTHGDYAAARFANARISSVRFSRFGESFLGLRIQRAEEMNFDQVTERGDLADAIDSQLQAAGAGGVFGEGHGQGHVYIDFAATDIPLAIATIERTLGQRGVTAPSALLFDEAGLEDQILPLQIAHQAH